MTENRSYEVRIGLAERVKGGVIFEVSNVLQASIARDAGAVAVMVVREKTASLHTESDLAQMANIEIIAEIKENISIPVMSKCRVGHFVEAQILEALLVDFIDESEELIAIDNEQHINKHKFGVPFVCGARDLAQALHRIGEGAALIRTYSEDNNGNIGDAVQSMRKIQQDIRQIAHMNEDELMIAAQKISAPFYLMQKIAESGKLPIPHFAAGGIHTPVDAALMMQLGADSIIVGTKIFKSEEPERHAKAMVQAVTHYREPERLREICLALSVKIPEHIKHHLSSYSLMTDRST